MAGEEGRGELVQDSIQNNTFHLVVKPLVSFSREQLFSLSLRNVKGVEKHRLLMYMKWPLIWDFPMFVYD